MADIVGIEESSLTSMMFDPNKLGLEIHIRALQCMEKLKTYIEQQYTWIDEALIEAKRTFSSPDIHMIPKTPSANRSRKLAQLREVDDDDNDFEELKPKRKARPKKTSRCAIQANSSSSGDSSGVDQGTSRATRSTRSRAGNNASSTGSNTTRASRRKMEDSEQVIEEPVMASENLIMSGLSEKEAESSAKCSPANPKTTRNDRNSTKMDTHNMDNVPLNDKNDAPVNKTVLIVSSEEDEEDEESASPPKKSRRKSSKVVTNENTFVPESPSKAPEEMELVETRTNDSDESREFNALKVKDKATKLEELLNKGGSLESSQPKLSAGRLTSATLNQFNKAHQSPSNSPQLNTNSPRKIAMSPTIVKPIVPHASPKMSKTSIVAAKQAFQTLLGASPKFSSPKIMSSSVVDENLKPLRRRSSRVSGSKLSLSKRRSSIHRHKTRVSIEKLQQLSHLEEIKVRLMNASKATISSDAKPNSASPVHSTRSKARANITKHNTPEKPQSKLQLSKMQHLSGHLADTPESGSDGQGSGSPHNSEYLNVVPPSNMAPARSTRSKARAMQKMADSSPLTLKSKRPSDGGDSSSRAKKLCANVTDDEVYNSPDRYSQASHPYSFINQLKKSRMTPNGVNTTINSFIQRNTPTHKPSSKDLIELRRQQLLAKEEQSKSRRLKVQEELAKQAEEKRKMRLQRQELAAQRRKEHEKEVRVAKERELVREKEKMQLKVKLAEQKVREEKERQKLREKKLEEVRKREIEKQQEREQQIKEQELEKQRQMEMLQKRREQEQNQKLKQVQEQRQKLEERQAELEKERQREMEQRQQLDSQRREEEEAQAREKEERERKERSERERLERERQKERERQRELEIEKQKEEARLQLLKEKEQQEDEKRAKVEEKHLQKLIEKHNNTVKTSCTTQTTNNNSHIVSNSTSTASQTSTSQYKAKPAPTDEKKPVSALNTTFNKSQEPVENNDSYELTPVRKVYKNKGTDENYGIEDMKSDDSTDDEEAPRKRIPSWASGPQLKALLITQHYNPPDLDAIFNYLDPPDLCKMFKVKKPKFYKRTSSAQWKTPMYLPSGKPME